METDSHGADDGLTKKVSEGLSSVETIEPASPPPDSSNVSEGLSSVETPPNEPPKPDKFQVSEGLSSVETMGSCYRIDAHT